MASSSHRSRIAPAPIAVIDAHRRITARPIQWRGMACSM